MKISMQAMTIDSFTQGLESLAALLEKGAAHAAGTGQDLVHARLAPDMFTLAQQVQSCCNLADDGVARLTGGKAAQISEPGESFAQLQEQIARTLVRVRGVDPAVFAGAEERDCTIEIPRHNIKFVMDGLQFLRGWALPHFYFHLVTAYGILRHHGVAIGKPDYVHWAGAFAQPLA